MRASCQGFVARKKGMFANMDKGNMPSSKMGLQNEITLYKKIASI